MKQRKTIIAAALAGVLALGTAGVATAHPGEGHRGPAPEAVSQRMDAMKAALKLSASQQPLWDAYANRMQQQMQAGMKLREQMQAARGNTEQMKQLQDQAFRQRAEAMAEITRARADLVRTLSVEQATIFRELGPGGMMRARHERMQRHMHEHGRASTPQT